MDSVSPFRAVDVQFRRRKMPSSSQESYSSDFTGSSIPQSQGSKLAPQSSLPHPSSSANYCSSSSHSEKYSSDTFTSTSSLPPAINPPAHATAVGDATLTPSGSSSHFQRASLPPPSSQPSHQGSPHYPNWDDMPPNRDKFGLRRGPTPILPKNAPVPSGLDSSSCGVPQNPALETLNLFSPGANMSNQLGLSMPIENGRNSEANGVDSSEEEEEPEYEDAGSYVSSIGTLIETDGHVTLPFKHGKIYSRAGMSSVASLDLSVGSLNQRHLEARRRRAQLCRLRVIQALSDREKHESEASDMASELGNHSSPLTAQNSVEYRLLHPPAPVSMVTFSPSTIRRAQKPEEATPNTKLSEATPPSFLIGEPTASSTVNSSPALSDHYPSPSPPPLPSPKREKKDVGTSTDPILRSVVGLQTEASAFAALTAPVKEVERPKSLPMRTSVGTSTDEIMEEEKRFGSPLVLSTSSPSLPVHQSVSTCTASVDMVDVGIQAAEVVSVVVTTRDAQTQCSQASISAKEKREKAIQQNREEAKRLARRSSQPKVKTTSSLVEGPRAHILWKEDESPSPTKLFQVLSPLQPRRRRKRSQSRRSASRLLLIASSPKFHRTKQYYRSNPIERRSSARPPWMPAYHPVKKPPSPTRSSSASSQESSISRRNRVPSATPTPHRSPTHTPPSSRSVSPPRSMSNKHVGRWVDGDTPQPERKHRMSPMGSWAGRQTSELSVPPSPSQSHAPSPRRASMTFRKPALPFYYYLEKPSTKQQRKGSTQQSHSPVHSTYVSPLYKKNLKKKNKASPKNRWTRMSPNRREPERRPVTIHDIDRIQRAALRVITPVQSSDEDESVDIRKKLRHNHF